MINNLQIDEIEDISEKLSNSCIISSDEIKYVALLENNESESEAWYYFIRYNGNEEALNHLQEQLQMVEFTLENELSTFDLDLDNFVCERTAKEMTKLELNHHSFHRKFDGKLKIIDLGVVGVRKNSKKIKKCSKILGYGQIDNFIDEEDIDEEDIDNDEDDEDDEDDEETSS